MSGMKKPSQFQIFHGMSINSTRIYIWRFLRGGPMNGEEPRYNLLFPHALHLWQPFKHRGVFIRPFQTSLMMSDGITVATVFMLNRMTRTLLESRNPSFPQRGQIRKRGRRRGNWGKRHLPIRRQRLIRGFNRPSMSVASTLDVIFMCNASIIGKTGCLGISWVLIFHIMPGARENRFSSPAAPSHNELKKGTTKPDRQSKTQRRTA